MKSGLEPFSWYSNKETIDKITKGERLPRPDNCPDNLWNLMVQCWNENPKLRPKFSQIAQTLKGLKEMKEKSTEENIYEYSDLK